ncbi:MAG: glycyl-radical enzyme activating protein, partial [Flavobacteriales bacterium]|nr:glycyl-radical enzyme activating protein [Flavobacteriales bacterium]
MSNTLVFDIKRYAINDGPGIRMTIFLKGCPLSCDWCHNPESQSSKVQKLYSKSKCITCGECVEACPTNAISLTDNGIITDFSLCETCGKCADVCPTKATEMSGEYKTVEELMLEVDKQKVFFQQSGGGVTISGGEPLMHSEFLNELLDALKENKIHTVIDTTGFSKPSILKNIAAKTDLFLYDLKMIDSVKH